MALCRFRVSIDKKFTLLGLMFFDKVGYHRIEKEVRLNGEKR